MTSAMSSHARGLDLDMGHIDKRAAQLAGGSLTRRWRAGSGLMVLSRGRRVSSPGIWMPGFSGGRGVGGYHVVRAGCGSPES